MNKLLRKFGITYGLQVCVLDAPVAALETLLAPIPGDIKLGTVLRQDEYDILL